MSISIGTALLILGCIWLGLSVVIGIFLLLVVSGAYASRRKHAPRPIDVVEAPERAFDALEKRSAA